MEIFLDVTGTCRSAKNTGVQRVTRGIYAELAGRTSVTAICFNTVGNFYHVLGERELQNLIAPFTRYRVPLARPDLRGEKLPSEVRRCLGRTPFVLGPELRRGSLLVVLDIFLDRRSHLLPAALRQSTGRAVAIFHDAATLRLGLFSRTAAGRFRAYVEALAAFDQVICISQESQSDLLALWREYGISNPPETCLEGWPLSVHSHDRQHADGRRGVPVVLCVSSLEARKNHLRLLQAAEHLWSSGCDFELKLVGRSTAAWGPKVVPKIHWLQGKGRPLTWLKHVDDTTLLGEYRECDFTVYPSLAEGFGLPIIESLSHGKPCICGGNGALGEIAGLGGCLMVDQTRVAELAHGIRLLGHDRKIYADLARQARERRFRSWPEYGNAFIGRLCNGHFRLRPAEAGNQIEIDRPARVDQAKAPVLVR